MMPRYDLPVRGKGDEVYVDLDSTNLVQESDETNNSAHFVIHRRADGTTDLPTCNRSYLHVIAKKGPTRTASTIAPLPTLPDLVMLGLCNRGHAWVAIRYVNRGAATKSAGFAISQGADSSHLEIMNKAYFPVPPPNEVQAFNVGEVADVIGRRGQSADIVVKLDDGGGLLESDKTNNIASAHVTHLEDGRVDLPDCDALEARAADPRWQNDEVVLQPAIVSLPDLVPLGACSQPRGQMDREVDIVYGNVGNGNVRGEVATRFREDGREFTTTLGPSNIGSNGLGRFQFFGPAPGRTLTLDVTLDSGNQLTESNEKNNSAHFEISGTEDKRFNLPDCSTRQRLADWL
jgi:hypothetical protein